MKEAILELREQGKSYNSIVSELGCSKSLVCYYCGTGQKDKSYLRGKKRRASNSLGVRLEQFKFRGPKRGRNELQEKAHNFKQKKRRYKGSPVSEDADFGMAEIRQLIESKPYCYLTGDLIDINKPESYQFDHIIPFSRGGGNSFKNLGLATKQANQAKRDLTVQEFIELCVKVLKHHGYEVKNK